MEELIFTPTDGKFSASFTSGVINVLQYKMPRQPKMLSIYGSIDTSLEPILLKSIPTPPVATILNIDVPQSIHVKLVCDVNPEQAIVRIS